jgi:hypothetical protein
MWPQKPLNTAARGDFVAPIIGDKMATVLLLTCFSVLKNFRSELFFGITLPHRERDFNAQGWVWFAITFGIESITKSETKKGLMALRRF